jgi:hypothetical protein
MDRLTFITDLVKSLAWPITAVAIAFGFRRHIALLLSNVSGFRYKDFEVQFGQRIEELKAEADRAKLPPAPEERRALEATPAPPRELFYLTELVEIAPKSAVIEAWREVERAASDTARRLKLPIAKTDVVRQLKASGRIAPNLMRIVDDLRQLRNSVAHVGEIDLSVDRAEEYVELALRVIGALREII